MSKNIEIFFCYAQEDELLRQGLEKQLRLLKREGVIDVWHNRQIEAGTEREHVIYQHLNTAQVILLLISPDFMDSDYCYDNEMKRAMERHARRDARVIPILLRPVEWHTAPFGKIQALPTNGKPVVSNAWHSQDEAFFEIAKGIRAVVETIKEEQQAPTDLPPINMLPVTETPAYAQQQIVLRVSQTPGETPYTTITEALEFAPSGARIEVQPGTYYEKLVIKRDMELVAAGPRDSVIIVSPAPCVRITAVQASIVQFRFHAQQKIGISLQGDHAAVEIENGSSSLHDCSITNTTGVGVSVQGRETAPSLFLCHIHDCKGQGILFSDHARGMLEACHIYANKAQGVEIIKGANPHFVKCRIDNGYERGVVVRQEGAGILEQCSISANGEAGLEIRDKGNPTLKGCDISLNEQSGVVIVEQGQGTLQDCSIQANNGDSIMIQSNSVPSIWGSKITEGKGIGIVIHGSSAAHIEGCEIRSNVGAGILVLQPGNSILRQCNILNNGYVGVAVKQGASATLEECTIERNTNYEVYVTEKSSISIRGGSILHTQKRDQPQKREQPDKLKFPLSAIWISDESKGAIEQCRIHTNGTYAVWIHKVAVLQLSTCEIQSRLYNVVVSKKSTATIYSSTLNASDTATQPYTCDESSMLFIDGTNMSPFIQTDGNDIW